MDAEEVDGGAGERHADSHQGVDGVAVEGNHHQEDAAQAVDDGEEQGQLQGTTGGRMALDYSPSQMIPLEARKARNC